MIFVIVIVWPSEQSEEMRVFFFFLTFSDHGEPKSENHPFDECAHRQVVCRLRLTWSELWSCGYPRVQQRSQSPRLYFNNGLAPSITLSIC